MKPLIPGGELKKVLNLGKGPEVGVWIEEQVKFMLENPMATKESLTTHLIKEKKKRETLSSKGGVVDNSNAAVATSDVAKNAPPTQPQQSRGEKKQRKG